MNALEQWRSRPMQVSVLDRCNECGELKEDVRKRVNCWPKITAVCCAKCIAEMTGEGFVTFTGQQAKMTS